MLRVGLTGGLGSGKSTVAAILRELGAQVIEADALGRKLMEPGERVYDEIVHVFGSEVVGPGGRLNRARLAELAFAGGRVQELNAIVHPATIAVQRQWMKEVFERDPAAVAVVESALLFEAARDARARGEMENDLADWRRRVDRVIVVVAPEELKIARYAARIGLSSRSGADESGAGQGTAQAAAEADARRRLAHQVPDAEKAAEADYVLDNSGDMASLRSRVEALWPRLQAESNKNQRKLSLQ